MIITLNTPPAPRVLAFIFGDDDPMPFGDYQGTPLVKVPHKVLIQLSPALRDSVTGEGRGVHDYIRRNAQRLTRQAPDAIWDER